jgi:enamine deaminase RidA (YjgF/YER057c/UK114 family)
MEYQTIYDEELGAKLQFSVFKPTDGLAEFHAIIQIEPRCDVFAGQLERLLGAETVLMTHPLLKGAQPVFKRFFLSDATNQQGLVEESLRQCHLGVHPTLSCIQQPPLNGSKVALWIYLVGAEAEVVYGADALGSTLVRHNGYEHLWTMGMAVGEGSSYEQSETLLLRYEQQLREHRMTLAENCIRTWFFVRDVDTQYKGLVVARRENFTDQGLTPDTHYIASTGIGGNPADPKAIIQLGCYALQGFQPAQQRYLYALTHLNKTYEYGVTFERGTLMEYGDRGHVFISGTASINNKGEVVHVGDVESQTHRMWENVETLLAEGGMTYDDVMQIIVYLRDMADYERISRLFEERFPNTPHVITLAPVCRPTWLIEMECIAVDGRQRDFRAF